MTCRWSPTLQSHFNLNLNFIWTLKNNWILIFFRKPRHIFSFLKPFFFFLNYNPRMLSFFVLRLISLFFLKESYSQQACGRLIYWCLLDCCLHLIYIHWLKGINQILIFWCFPETRKTFELSDAPYCDDYLGV